MKSWVAAVAALVAAVTVGCSRQGGGEQASKPSATSVVVLDESNFDSQVKSGVVLVDFWATWCGPCRVQGPIVEQVAEQLKGKAVVAKLDVDAAPKVAQRFQISSIPTLVVFKDGKITKKFVGVTQAEALVAALTAALNPEPPAKE